MRSESCSRGSAATLLRAISSASRCLRMNSTACLAPRMTVGDGRASQWRPSGQATMMPAQRPSVHQAQNFPVLVVGEYIKPSVRALAHVPDPFAQRRQQALLLDDLAAVELQPHEGLPAQSAEEQIALPSRI